MTTKIPLVLALFSVGVSGCGLIEDAFDDLCDPQLEARVEALEGAANALVATADDMKSDVYDACVNIATDLGGSPPVVAGVPTDTEVEQACAAAVTEIQAEIAAGAQFQLVVVPAVCHVDATAQFACETACDIDGACEPGSVEVRCDPGELSVECDADCYADAYCEADFAFACQGSCSGVCSGGCSAACVGEASCTGSCQGHCVGTCDGTWVSGGPAGGECTGNCTGECSGTCAVAVDCYGTCSGSCSGQCTGSCQLDADAQCGADVRCRGGCSGTYQAPRCESELDPPSCTIDADCSAACEAQGAIGAQCSPPEAVIVATGAADIVTLQNTLETNLPVILETIARGEEIGTGAGDVATRFGDTVAEGAELVECALIFGTTVVDAASATVAASASLSVSVSASVSVQTAVVVQ